MNNSLTYSLLQICDIDNFEQERLAEIFKDVEFNVQQSKKTLKEYENSTFNKSSTGYKASYDQVESFQKNKFENCKYYLPILPCTLVYIKD